MTQDINQLIQIDNQQKELINESIEIRKSINTQTEQVLNTLQKQDITELNFSEELQNLFND